MSRPHQGTWPGFRSLADVLPAVLASVEHAARRQLTTRREPQASPNRAMPAGWRPPAPTATRANRSLQLEVIA